MIKKLEYILRLSLALVFSLTFIIIIPIYFMENFGARAGPVKANFNG